MLYATLLHVEGQPAYSSSICLIEKNPEIVEHAVLKNKKCISLFIDYIYYIRNVFSTLGN